MSSCELQMREGVPSAAILYTSEPPLAPPPGTGNGPICIMLGADGTDSPGGVEVVGGGGVMVIIAEVPVIALIPELGFFSPTPAAKMFPCRWSTSAVISFFAAL